MKEAIEKYLAENYPNFQHEVRTGGHYGVTNFGEAEACVRSTVGAPVISCLQSELCKHFNKSILAHPVLPAYFGDYVLRNHGIEVKKMSKYEMEGYVKYMIGTNDLEKVLETLENKGHIVLNQSSVEKTKK